MNEAPILIVKDLAVSYKTRKDQVNAVRDVSFDICEGETWAWSVSRVVARARSPSPS